MNRLVLLLFMFGLLLTVMAVAQDAPLFHVVTNNNLNLRACASTDCDRMGQVPAGTELPVYSTEGDWFQVLVDGELVWVAGWLTTPRPVPVPDNILKPEETLYDSKSDCVVHFDAGEGNRDLAVLISGERRQEVQIDVFLPGESTAIPVQGSVRDAFIDTGAPFIHQYYSPGTRWENGLYRIQLQLDDITSIFWWRVEDGTVRRYTIRVRCGRPGPYDPILLPGLTHQDPETGCLVHTTFEPGSDGRFLVAINRTGNRHNDVNTAFQHARHSGDDYSTGSGWNRVLKYLDGEWHQATNLFTDGLYKLKIELDDQISAMNLSVDQYGFYMVNVHCDGGGTTLVATLRPVRTPSSIPTQLAPQTKTGTGAQANVCSTVSALRTDIRNFWSDLREANHGRSATDPGYHIRFSENVLLQRIRDSLPTGWPVELTTAQDLEHLINSGALSYPSSRFFASNLYELYKISWRVAPEMKVPLVGLGYCCNRIPASIARGFAEIGRAADLMDSSIERLVEECQ